VKETFEAGLYFVSICVAVIFGGIMGHELTVMKFDKEIKKMHEMVDLKYPQCLQELMREEVASAGSH
jgi:hypothetical protein